jgi:oligopeptide transport system substrate-binding protein
MVSGFILGHVMQGLLAFGPRNGEYVPGVAETWTVSPTGAVFRLRPEARWSDGKWVTAGDFVFGWRTVVDPKTAAPGAYFLSCIKNAQAITAGRAPVESLGVSAPDEHTLRVEFVRPCPYFASLTPITPFMPVREDFYRAHRATYGSAADQLVYNGPFVISKWVHGAELELVKNPLYWDAGKIQLDRLRIPYITSNSSALFNLFKNGDIDVLDRLTLEDLPSALREHYPVRSFVDGSVWFLAFNFQDGRLTRNLHLRRAIAALFNAEEFASKVVGIPGTRRGLGLVPQWVKGSVRTFREEYPISARKPDFTTARKELRLAMDELRLSKPPALVLLTGDLASSARDAEYLQRQFKSVLGIELRIDQQTPKQRFAKMRTGDFDLVESGWGVAFEDAMNFAELLTSWNPMNPSHYQDPRYDEAIRLAQSSSDTRGRLDAMASAERVALEDVAIVPLFERVQTYLTRPGVEGVSRHLVGPDPYFVYASVRK